MNTLKAILLAAIAFALAGSAPASDTDTASIKGLSAVVQEQDTAKVEKSKVRYGKLTTVDLKKDKIAVVNSKKVYLSIPAYKTIVKDKVERGCARYVQLMEEATSVFRATLKKVALKKGVKLIVEVGGTSGIKTTDVTDAIIEAL
jgi:uncharacterized cupredoxin-like copper-binding protein